MFYSFLENNKNNLETISIQKDFVSRVLQTIMAIKNSYILLKM